MAGGTMTRKEVYRSAAILTISRANQMTPEGRKALAAWLRWQAGNLVKDGTKYAPRFCARYLYSPR